MSPRLLAPLLYRGVTSPRPLPYLGIQQQPNGPTILCLCLPTGHADIHQVHTKLNPTPNIKTSCMTLQNLPDGPNKSLMAQLSSAFACQLDMPISTRFILSSTQHLTSSYVLVTRLH
ncbi:hypothetical protein L1887_28564 [Cichorium endivia]|nr:hypothetical protein L1887_28564 [Cichorium endivia]